MVSQDDQYPEFPKLECSACGEKFELPRRWVSSARGNQIIISWLDAEVLMKAHHESHNLELVTGVEEFLRGTTR